MFLAQVQASPLQIGEWLIGAGVIVWIVAQMAVGVAAGRKLFAREKPQEDLYVTHGQFDEFKAEYRADLNKLRGDVKAMIGEAEANRKEQISELTRYTHDAFHRQSDALQKTANNIAYIRGALESRGSIAPRSPEEEHGK